jgi:DNA invertase Pin-like site-specific DNA recombinase
MNHFGNRKFVAYYRVSTVRQRASGLGLEAQQRSVRDYLTGANLIGEFTEIESGRSCDRPKLHDALATCRVHNAVLVIAKLDRLARSVAFVSNLMEAGIDFQAVDFPQANRLTVHILASVAEHEARIISERTTAALRVARTRGVKLGGFRGRVGTPENCARATVARSAKANQRAADLSKTLIEMRTRGSLSLKAIADHLNSKSIGAPRGGFWSAAQVRRELHRIHRSPQSS